VKVLSFQPCVPVVLHRRSCESVEDIGMNELVEWRPDSSMLVVAVSIVLEKGTRHGGAWGGEVV
jgi:hypothetical protein